MKQNNTPYIIFEFFKTHVKIWWTGSKKGVKYTKIKPTLKKMELINTEPLRMPKWLIKDYDPNC